MRESLRFRFYANHHRCSTSLITASNCPVLPPVPQWVAIQKMMATTQLTMKYIPPQQKVRLWVGVAAVLHACACCRAPRPCPQRLPSWWKNH